MVPLVYHPGYNIRACGLERLHPFDSVKYRRIHDELIRQGLRRPGDFHRPAPLRRADLVVYNAGSDVLADDPLSTLLLSPAQLAERDLMVLAAVRQRGIPAAVVLSGGYGPQSWRAHALSIEGILARFEATTGPAP
jgi:hypothetical protein